MKPRRENRFGKLLKAFRLGFRYSCLNDALIRMSYNQIDKSVYIETIPLRSIDSLPTRKKEPRGEHLVWWEGPDRSSNASPREVESYTICDLLQKE